MTDRPPTPSPGERARTVAARGPATLLPPVPTLPPADVPVSLVPDADGWVRMVPSGRGTRWLASALWAEALLAQQAGLWPRLKLCHNIDCRAAFFDTSRNNSGVWHDVSTCGNTANLRAFRERKRLMGGSGGQHRPAVPGPLDLR